MFAAKATKPQMKAAAASTHSLERQSAAPLERPFGSRAMEEARMLQQTFGNQATLRYLTQQHSHPPAGASGQHPPPLSQEYSTCCDTRTTSEVRRLQFPFVATVPRVRPAAVSSDNPLFSARSAMGRVTAPGYGDSAQHDGDTPTKSSAAPSSSLTAHVAEVPERRRDGTTLFPVVIAPSEPVPSQADAGISSTLSYTSAITQTHDAPDPGDFGTTHPNYTISHIYVETHPDNFLVTADTKADITFSVTSAGKTNIASDSDPHITQANYPDVVKDLTPSPRDVALPHGKLLKNEPPRNQFWAEDLTIQHEKFHADEDVHFGQEGVTLAQNWLNTQRMSHDTDILPLAQLAINRVRDKVTAEMAYPGREYRAYNDGAPAYSDRAAAIKTKGDAKGYVPKPPAPQPPAPKQPAPKQPPPQQPAP